MILRNEVIGFAGFGELSFVAIRRRFPRIWAAYDSDRMVASGHSLPSHSALGPINVRFSNRPVGVKHFQTIHHCSVDVAHGLALLFGLGTKALPSWDSRTRWNNLSVDLAVRVTAGSSDRTNSPHPSSREGHHSTARWSSSVLLSHVILISSHAAAASRVH